MNVLDNGVLELGEHNLYEEIVSSGGAWEELEDILIALGEK